MATEEFNLKVWRCHPMAGRVIPAERSLNGTAHDGGLKFCGPYTYANKSGYWLFPPVDVDIKWKGGKDFEVRWWQEYDDSDYHLLRSLLMPKDNVSEGKWSLEGIGRNKFTWGMVEDGVVQMWTGNIFETPPGWCLHIRSPINFPRRPCYVMEGILETDWMQQDIWTNIVFDRKDEWVEFRREGYPPLAQLVPIRRESFAEDWKVTDEMLNRDSPEANRVFEYWINFNEKKFARGGKQNLLPDGSRTKDSTTFYKEKQRCIGSGMEPKKDAIIPKGCPFHKAKDKVVVYCINDNPRYQEMLLNSVAMLRKYNQTIPVKVIYINEREDIADYNAFREKLAPHNVQVIEQMPFRPDTKYFSINKVYLQDLPEDSVLYLDVDTFVNGDVEKLFDKYRSDLTVIESEWAYVEKWGWKDDLLPNKGKPVNSGIQLFHNHFHQKMFSRLSDTFDKLSGHDTPLAKWSWGYFNGCLREELACALILAESGASYMFFQRQDCYNIQRIEDIARCHEPIVFHSYTRQWDMVKKWCKVGRKLLWPKRGKTDEAEDRVDDQERSPVHP